MLSILLMEFLVGLNVRLSSITFLGGLFGKPEVEVVIK